MPVRLIISAAALQSPPPLRKIRRPALANQNPGAGDGSHVGEAAEVRSVRKRRIDDNAEAEAELCGGEAENDVV